MFKKVTQNTNVGILEGISFTGLSQVRSLYVQSSPVNLVNQLPSWYGSWGAEGA